MGIAMNAQANVKEEAPNAVITAFNKLFPKATDVIWEQDEQEYIIYFSEGEIAKYCRLDTKGKWLEKGVALITDLSKSMMGIISGRYKEIEVSEKYSVILSDKRKATLVIFSVEGEYIEMLITTKGDILRERYLSTQDEGEEEEEDDDWK